MNPIAAIPQRELRCRCGCLLAKVTTPIRVSYGADVGPGIEIRCRRCKAHALLVPAARHEQGDPDELRGAE